MVDVYVFSSQTLTNVWAGIGARRWAVSMKQAANSSIQTKARALPIGSLGLFYCSEAKSITTPFIVRSRPDERSTVTNVWPEEWALPFRIVPLGSPDLQVPTGDLKSGLPSLQGNDRAWNRLLHFQPSTVFAASKITAQDWTYIVDHLIP